MKLDRKIILSVSASLTISMFALAADSNSAPVDTARTTSAVPKVAPAPAEKAAQASLPAATTGETDAPDVEATAYYSLVLSTGFGPADKDIFITKRVGNIYSFRYCPAKDKEGKATAIAQIRVDRFAHPEKYQEILKNAKIVINEKLNSRLAAYFSDQNICEPIGTGSYGFISKFSHENGGVEPDTGYNTFWWSVMSLASGVGSAVSSSFVVSGARDGRAGNNTLSVIRFALSRHFPHGRLALAIALAGAAPYFGNLAWEDHKENYGIRDFADASYLRFEDDGKPSWQSVLAIDSSMADFKSEFLLGLQAAIKYRAFVEL